MKIPESIYLHGKKIDIDWLPKAIKMKGGGHAIAFAYLNEDRIEIAKKSPNGEAYSHQTKEQAFLHELCHLILYQLDQALTEDEKFVDDLSNLLHQVIKQLTDEIPTKEKPDDANYRTRKNEKQ